MYEYTTVEQARAALETAIQETCADQGMSPDDVAYDLIIATAQFSTPAVARELCRGELGYVPQDAVLGAVTLDQQPDGWAW